MKLLIVFFLLFVFARPSQAQNLKVGVASVDITPPIGVPLAGFGGGGRRAKPFEKKSKYSTYLRPSTGVLDPIHAKAFYVESSTQRLLFVSLDMIGGSRAMRKDILRHLTGFTENELYLSGTHTHSGPGAFEKNWLWEIIAADKFKQEVYDYLVDGVLRAITIARLRAQPATVHYFSFKARDLQINRRNRPGHFDDDAHIVMAKNMKGQWVGGFANLAIHGTMIGPGSLLYSADVPGAIATSMESRVAKLNSTGSTRPVFLFMNGAEGDVAPKYGQEMNVLGELFADQATAHLSEAMPLGSKWSTKQAVVDLGSPKFGNCTKTKIGYIISQATNPLLLTAFPKESRMWRISWGPLEMVTVPGEFTTDLGFALRDTAFKNGAKHALVLGLTNDHLSYLVTPSEYWEGLYESCSSFYGDSGGMKFIEKYREMF